MRSIILLALLMTGCVSIGGTSYPACSDVYKYRPDLFGKVFCHMPASSQRDAETTRAAIQRNDDQRTVRNAILDADRAIEHGNNP